MNPTILWTGITKIASLFISKKRVVGWVSAIAIAVGAAAAGMQTTEFKEAVCGAPILEPVK